jgi:hypothetical protein
MQNGNEVKESSLFYSAHEMASSAAPTSQLPSTSSSSPVRIISYFDKGLKLSTSQIAHLALEQQKYKKAIECADEMLVEDDSMTDAFYIKARALFNSNQSNDEVIRLCEHILAGNTYYDLSQELFDSQKKEADEFGLTIVGVADVIAVVNDLLQTALQRKNQIDLLSEQLKQIQKEDDILIKCQEILALEKDNRKILLLKLTLCAKNETSFKDDSPTEKTVDELVTHYPLDKKYAHMKSLFTLLRTGFQKLEEEKSLTAEPDFLSVLKEMSDLKIAWQGLFISYLSPEKKITPKELEQVYRAQAIFKDSPFIVSDLPLDEFRKQMEKRWFESQQNDILAALMKAIETKVALDENIKKQWEKILQNIFINNKYWECSSFLIDGDNGIQNLKAALLAEVAKRGTSQFQIVEWGAGAYFIPKYDYSLPNPDKFISDINTIIAEYAQRNREKENAKATLITAQDEEGYEVIASNKNPAIEYVKETFKNELIATFMAQYGNSYSAETKLDKPAEASSSQPQKFDVAGISKIAHPNIAPAVSLAAMAGNGIHKLLVTDRNKAEDHFVYKFCPDYEKMRLGITGFANSFANAYQEQFLKFQTGLEPFARFVANILINYLKTNFGKHKNLPTEIFYKIVDPVLPGQQPDEEIDFNKIFLQALADHPDSDDGSKPFTILSETGKQRWSMSGLIRFVPIHDGNYLYGNQNTEMNACNGYGERSLIHPDEPTIMGFKSRSAAPRCR